ncbi:alpha/beta fold hydrolase [Natrarchaeobius chitinivorans]|uniref:Alpha/beta hydrolase n=1 Tax=Natrarchaeobius chitinivorans TaxID=1679083 RepID=A0A3N6M264_NATCH|nr:alpha/beta hydrolase [Natrarchaeobius chitinivorans]RQG95857.1 alpha/beta hydrolase [Natrarchaeobius chitinivorans]
MDAVTHHGRQTAYDVTSRSGAGPPLCCIHGSGGSRDRWRFQRRLADHAPVVSLDLSGHGESDDIDATPGYSTLSAYADDVLAVVDATESRTLLGGSLGGAVALHVLLERDVDLDGVILTGTGARLGVLDDLLTWLQTDFDRAVEFLHEPGCFFADPDPELRDRSVETMYECGQAVTRRDFLTCHTFDVRDRLEEIDVPTLVIYGTRDRLTPPWYHEYLADEIPDCDAVEISDVGHLSMLERPETFNDAVEGFLTSLE